MEIPKPIKYKEKINQKIQNVKLSTKNDEFDIPKGNAKKIIPEIDINEEIMPQIQSTYTAMR
ncbi:MAG: hypothetical protein EAX89_05235 [Candidatus Lokiarchaeota archaeon]|nr:hypothetical protein [Candidatus Lokiarchaeota archaeon]